MKKFRYNKQKHQVDEEMASKEPDINDYTIVRNGERLWRSSMSEEVYEENKNHYNEAKKSLLTSIPVIGGVDWVDQEILEEGKDLELKSEYFGQRIVKHGGIPSHVETYHTTTAIPLTSKL